MNAAVAIEIRLIDPGQLVPDLEVSVVVGRELRDARMHVGASSAPRQKLCIPRERVDHPRPVRVEEVVQAERFFLLGKLIGGFQADFQMPITCLLTGERFQLDEHRWNEIEGDFDIRELAQERHHAPVILQCVQSDPRKNVLAGNQILVERLMHVPEQSDARHNHQRPCARA